jgi:sigma-E factor negative regulatory protein RseB
MTLTAVGALLLADNGFGKTPAADDQAAKASIGAEELGRDWIEKMSRAMQDETYVGTFVYIHDADVETMKIYHSKIDGVEHERLLSLNGEAREIIRDADSVVCIWPGSKSVIVSKAQPRTPFPQFDPQQLNVLSEFYDFRKGRDARVAGRRTQVIDIVPLDNYRYGYRLWIDTETFLLIRSAMSDASGRLVEQVMFTDITFPDQVPLEMFSASIGGKRHEWMVDNEPVAPPIEPIIGTDIPGVDEMALPGGFSLVSNQVTPVAGTMNAVRRLMYSDGLASLSVFITNASDDSAGELNGGTSMGAVNAFGVRHDAWHATVVGEVPHATVEMLAKSMLIAGR